MSTFRSEATDKLHFLVCSCLSAPLTQQVEYRQSSIGPRAVILICLGCLTYLDDFHLAAGKHNCDRFLGASRFLCSSIPRLVRIVAKEVY